MLSLVFLLSTTTTVLLAVLIPLFVLLVVGGILIVLFKRKKDYQMVQQEFRRIHSSFLELSRRLLNRLKGLGEFSEEYRKVYQEKEKQLAEIVTRKDKRIQGEINQLEKLKKEKKGKEFRLLLSEVQKEIPAFEKMVQSFNEDLTGHLHEDDETREKAIPAKEKFRRIREFYGQHVEELKPLQKTFTLLFENTEDVFSHFEDDVSQARFAQAQKRIPPIEKVLDAVLALLDNLPVMVAQTTSILPEGLSDLERNYKELLSEDYILDNLHVEEFLERSRRTLQDVEKRLVLLDTRNVPESLSSIQEGIDRINDAFAKEKQAKEAFLSIKEDAFSDSTFRLEKRYSSYCNQLPEYQKTYKLQDSRVQELLSLKKDIERIGFLQRDLISFVDTSQRRPYTIIMNCAEEMNNEMEKVNKILDSYSDYLTNLKKVCQHIHGELRRLDLSLLESKGEIQRLSVEALEKKTEKIIPPLFEELSRIDQILYKTPVDVEKAKEMFDPFLEKTERFLEEVREKRKEEREARKAILEANLYRDDFKDSRPLIEEAVSQYWNGQFLQAKESALEVKRTFTVSQEENNA